MSGGVHVEVLHHEGCPLFAQVLELIHECVRDLGADAIVAERVCRYPSPTVLVDGHDVMGVPVDGMPLDACRLDVPTHERVVEALISALSSA